VLALAARAGQRRAVVSPTETVTVDSLFIPCLFIRKDFKQQGYISSEIGSVVM
jgi:hypothetical protein